MQLFQPFFFYKRSFFFVFVFFSPTESQLFTITSQPSSPVNVLEGQDLKLEWTFRVQRTFLRVQLSFSGNEIPFLEKSLTSILLSERFSGRLTASTTETNATITLFNVSRTDSNNYVFTVRDTNGASAIAPFQVVVQCKYERFLPSSLFTDGSQSQFLRLVWKHTFFFHLSFTLKLR